MSVAACMAQPEIGVSVGVAGFNRRWGIAPRPEETLFCCGGKDRVLPPIFFVSGAKRYDCLYFFH
jgi:hypothetical protein